jgi:uncharacterized protein YuzE
MKIRYFADTDTLYIEFRDHGIVDTRDLDENTTMDVDAEGNVLALTLEHASARTDLSQLVLEGIAA